MKNLLVILLLLSSNVFSQSISAEDKMDFIIYNIDDFYKQENFDSAYHYFNEGLIISDELENKDKLVDLYFSFGPHYNSIGLYDKALELYLKAEKLISKTDVKRRMSLYNRISYVFSKKKDFVKALEYIEKAIKIAIKIDNNEALLDFKISKANILQQTEEYQSAILIYKECLELIDKKESPKDYAITLNNLGVLYKEIDVSKIAEDYFIEAYEIAKEIEYNALVAYIEMSLGDLYRINREFEKSKYFFNLSIENAKNVNYIVIDECNFKYSYLLYKELGDYKQSLTYLEKYQELTDSLNKLNSDNTILALETQFRTKEKDGEIEFLNKENELNNLQLSKKNWIITFSSLLIILALILLIIVFKSKKNQAIANKNLKLKNQEIEHQKQEITDSINYARIIQSSIFGDEDRIVDVFSNSAVFHKPKDIVSGDFFWMHKNDDKFIFTVADCTGHGVPGAMVSMIGNNALNESVKFKGMTKTDEILNHLSEYVHKAFSFNNETKNGMDIAICSLDLRTNEIEYSGAFNSLYIFKQSGAITEVKSDKNYVGQEGSTYKSTKVQLEKGDFVYIMSDGYCDQFGGESGKKFKISRFKEMIIANLDKSAQEQKQLISDEFEKWKGSNEQVDDVCVAVIKI